MEVHLRVVGVLMIALSLLHIVIPKYLRWDRELMPLSLVTKQILYVHTFFVAFMVMLMGLVTLLYSHELLHNPFGRIISIGLFTFWAVRLFFQFLVYSPKLWRGKRFETAVHILFSCMWVYFSGVYLVAAL